MSNTLYSKLFPKKDPAIRPLEMALEECANILSKNGATMLPEKLAKKSIAMEQFGESEAVDLDLNLGRLRTAFESMSGEINVKTNRPRYTQTQIEAGLCASIITSDIVGATHAKPGQVPAMENLIFMPAFGDNTNRTKKALETYDERENRSTTTFSIAYNMEAARQNEFAETLYPTVVVPPDQLGYTISIRLVQVYDEVRRNISGAVSENFKKRNIIHALIDPSILRNEGTRVFPVYRDESKANFVDPALVAPSDIMHEGVSITTAPLAIGKKFSLLGISQTEALLATGMLDSTDALDPAMQLEKLYMKIGSGADTEVIRFGSLDQMQISQFTHALQGNSRLMNLMFNTEALLINQNTLLNNGNPSKLLAPVVNGKYNVRLSSGIYGNSNVELGDTSLSGGEVHIMAITDQDGVSVDLNGTVGKQLAAIFDTAVMFGYDLVARRTNSNRRERGQLLDLTVFNMIYAVPLLSPITIPRPLTAGDQNDASDLGALLSATHVRTTNAAVAELLKAAASLRTFKSMNGGVQSYDPEILGVSRLLLTPFYDHKRIDLPVEMDSVKSHERIADIRATLVNEIRDGAYRAYRDSGYKPAADSLAGGNSPVPTVIIATDPYIAQYLLVEGDFRTIGNDFNVKIVSSWNMHMAGKMFLTFGHFGEGLEGVPNPMHFGNMAWKPEMTLVLPIHRNGANNKELTVQPSFRHITNLPILFEYDVTGLGVAATSKAHMLVRTI